MAKPMKKFLVTYHMTAPARKKAAQSQKNMTPEMQQAAMQGWMEWAQKCGDALVEMGAPLGESVKLDASGAAAPSRRGVSGYSIVQAKSMAGAKKLFKKHPHLSWVDAGCDIEVHEITPM